MRLKLTLLDAITALNCGLTVTDNDIRTKYDYLTTCVVDDIVVSSTNEEKVIAILTKMQCHQ